MNTNNLLILLLFLNSASNVFSQNTFKMPKENWKVEINLDNFEIKKEGFSLDNTLFQLSAIDSKNQSNLTFFIEKNELKGEKEDKEECREFYWNKAKNSPLAKEKWLNSSYDSILR
jgi:hypothetical protein